MNRLRIIILVAMVTSACGCSAPLPEAKLMLLPAGSAVIKGNAKSAEQLQDEQKLAGQWTNYYCRKGGRLYILQRSAWPPNHCRAAYKKFIVRLGSIDNDQVHCDTVFAVAPYSICH